MRPNIKKSALLAAVALGLSVAPVAFTATPASASLSQCNSNGYCFWEDIGWSGGYAHWFGSTQNLNGYGYNNGTGNNEDNSMTGHYNHFSTNTVTTYFDPVYYSKMFCVSPGYGTDWVGSGWNDGMTSFRVDGCH